MDTGGRVVDTNPVLKEVDTTWNTQLSCTGCGRWVSVGDIIIDNNSKQNGGEEGDVEKDTPHDDTDKGGVATIKHPDMRNRKINPPFPGFPSHLGSSLSQHRLEAPTLASYCYCQACEGVVCGLCVVPKVEAMSCSQCLSSHPPPSSSSLHPSSSASSLHYDSIIRPKSAGPLTGGASMSHPQSSNQSTNPSLVSSITPPLHFNTPQPSSSNQSSALLSSHSQSTSHLFANRCKKCVECVECKSPSVSFRSIQVSLLPPSLVSSLLLSPSSSSSSISYYYCGFCRWNSLEPVLKENTGTNLESDDGHSSSSSHPDSTSSSYTPSSALYADSTTKLIAKSLSMERERVDRNHFQRLLEKRISLKQQQQQQHLLSHSSSTPSSTSSSNASTIIQQDPKSTHGRHGQHHHSRQSSKSKPSATTTTGGVMSRGTTYHQHPMSIAQLELMRSMKEMSINHPGGSPRSNILGNSNGDGSIGGGSSSNSGVRLTMDPSTVKYRSRFQQQEQQTEQQKKEEPSSSLQSGHTSSLGGFMGSYDEETLKALMDEAKGLDESRSKCMDNPLLPLRPLSRLPKPPPHSSKLPSNNNNHHHNNTVTSHFHGSPWMYKGLEGKSLERVPLIPITSKKCLKCDRILIKPSSDTPSSMAPSSSSSNLSVGEGGGSGSTSMLPDFKRRHTAMAYTPSFSVRASAGFEGYKPTLQMGEWNMLALTITNPPSLPAIHVTLSSELTQIEVQQPNIGDKKKSNDDSTSLKSEDGSNSSSIDGNSGIENSKTAGSEIDDSSLLSSSTTLLSSKPYCQVDCAGCSTWVLEDEPVGMDEDEGSPRENVLPAGVPSILDLLEQDSDNPAILMRKSRQVSFVLMVMPERMPEKEGVPLTCELEVRVTWPSASANVPPHCLKSPLRINLLSMFDLP